MITVQQLCYVKFLFPSSLKANLCFLLSMDNFCHCYVNVYFNYQRTCRTRKCCQNHYVFNYAVLFNIYSKEELLRFTKVKIDNLHLKYSAS